MAKPTAITKTAIVPMAPHLHPWSLLHYMQHAVSGPSSLIRLNVLSKCLAGRSLATFPGV